MTIAFVFPGQGSQSLGMLNDLATRFPQVQETFDSASDTLGFDLWQLVQKGPEETLNSTENTQPALLTSSIALWRVWQSQSEIAPTILSGHSLGEYSALVCAGVLEFTDAVALVKQRGEFMQNAVAQGEGAMAAILGLDDQIVVDLCSNISGSEVVSAANFNSPGQVVIAGHTRAVEKAVEKAKEEGAKRSVILPVSVPSHCPLMQTAAEQLSEVMATMSLAESSIPVVQNVNGEIQKDVAGIQTSLIEQLYKPVQWTSCIKTIVTQEITQIIECGPGKVLSGLIKRIDRQISCFPISDQASLDKALEALNN